jgi:hypothetical protein
MLLANYGSATASNLTQFSQDYIDGHVVSTYHAEDGSFENIHSAEWTHGTTSTEASYQRQRQSLTETIYHTENVQTDPDAYGNGNWYVLCGVRSGTDDRSITFKIDLMQASYIFFEATICNSADATSRTHTISYSFDNVTYTQLQTYASWASGGVTLRDTVYFNTTAQNNYTGQIYLRSTISGATSVHDTLVGWTGFKIKSMAQSMSFNTNKTFRGDSRYVMQYCTDATQNAAIISANTGFMRFGTHINKGSDDNNIMAQRTSGNYGIQFKKAGWVKYDFHQDIATTGTSSYCWVYVLKGTASQIDANSADQVGEFLITDTNGGWDTISGSGLVYVEADDVLGFRINATAITGLDSAQWSLYLFDWFEQKIY